jgi:hypothetical protein
MWGMSMSVAVLSRPVAVRVIILPIIPTVITWVITKGSSATTMTATTILAAD